MELRSLGRECVIQNKSHPLQLHLIFVFFLLFPPPSFHNKKMSSASSRSWSNPSVFAVAKGHTPGVYFTRKDLAKQISGFPSPLWKEFHVATEAREWLRTANRPTLNRAAQSFMDMMKRPELHPGAIFLSGVAGTGKSTLIKQAIEDAWEEYRWSIPDEDERANALQVCACTANAALLLSDTQGDRWTGRTFHSMLGWVPPPQGLFFGLTKRLEDVSKSCAERLRQLRRVFVDEASMIDPVEFSLLDPFLRAIRRSKEPFGGVKFVFIGDFHQLGPVRSTNRRTGDKEYLAEEASILHLIGKVSEEAVPKCVYMFQLPIFKELVPNVVLLTQCYRQEDVAFVALLHRASVGRLTEEDCKMLERCERTQFPEGVVPTCLVATKKMAKGINDESVKKLPDQWPVVVYPTVWDCTPKNAARRQRLASLAMDILKDVKYEPPTLRRGTLVVVTMNTQDPSVCNGRQGKVIDFVRIRPPPTDEFDDMLPLDDEEEIDEFAIPAPAADIYEKYDWSSPVENGTTLSPETWYPVIRFVDDGTEHILKGTTRSIEYPDDGTIRITCMPLMMAWAMTVHRSQGMTLRYVQYIPENTFADGQGYTALSRVRSLDGLKLVEFDARYVTAHREVKNFYERLEAQARQLEADERDMESTGFDLEFGDGSLLLSQNGKE